MVMAHTNMIWRGHQVKRHADVKEKHNDGKEGSTKYILDPLWH